jgi:hypothetical protein
MDRYEAIPQILPRTARFFLKPISAQILAKNGATQLNLSASLCALNQLKSNNANAI